MAFFVVKNGVRSTRLIFDSLLTRGQRAELYVDKNKTAGQSHADMRRIKTFAPELLLTMRKHSLLQ
ncbi:hypothetical protein B4923_08085 [Brenneria roseae subsp. americana]|uniref:Uncharacterized protein n=1 Tax=Brenneria roseae subsp. americana TaxID=1508507 RepID=A0A2U1TUT1_9GAMM|nr:hypothetical protein B4923_08085 [Brenneria roseae subsp. americana]